MWQKIKEKFFPTRDGRMNITPSNIIQFDDMGYPLLLCLVEEKQKISLQWIDVSVEWAQENLENGHLKVLEWIK